MTLGGAIYIQIKSHSQLLLCHYIRLTCLDNVLPKFRQCAKYFQDFLLDFLQKRMGQYEKKKCYTCTYKFYNYLN